MERAKLLIVETDSTTASEIEDLLIGMGYQILPHVDSAKKAIEQAERHRPDLMIMDNQLSGDISGVETAVVIRQRFDIPVVFLVDQSEEDIVGRTKSAMPFGYIFRPVQERDLRVTVEMALVTSKIDAERKQVKKELEINEDFLNETNFTAKVGGWEFDLETSKTRWTKGTYRIYDLPFDYEPKLDEIITFFEIEEQNKMLDVLDRAIKYREPFELELRFKTSKGDSLWTHAIGKPVMRGGKVGKLVGTFQDITERKNAEKALITSEKRYKELVSLLPQVVFESDAKGKLTFVNQFAFEIFKYTRSDFEQGINALDFVISEDQESAMTNIGRVLTGEEIGGNEYVMQRKDGTQFPVIVHSTRIMEGDIPVGLRGIIIDISDRKIAEEELEKNEKKYRQIFENAQTPYFEVSVEGKILEVSPSIENFLLYKREELIGISFEDLYADLGQRDRFQKTIMNRGAINNEEALVLDKDGSVVQGLINAKYIADERKIIGSLQDITDRKQAEENLKKSEETFRSIVESSPMGIHLYRLEADDRLVFMGANPAADRIVGIDHSEVIGKTIEEAFPALIDTEIPNRYRQAAVEGIPWHTEQIEYTDERIEGAFEVHAFQMTPGNMAVLFFDVTERKQSEQALKNSEGRFRQLAENIKEVFWIISPDWSQVHYVSPAFKEIWQVEEAELYQNGLIWLESILPEDRDKIDEFLAQKQPGDVTEIIMPDFRILRPDGSERWILVRGFPVRDEAGQIERITGITEDITERKKTQEMMVQTEKMMSVGGLAAGMAHEINNPLSAILQGIQNVRRRLSADLKPNLGIAEETGLDLQRLKTYMEKRGITDHLIGIQKAGKKASDIISNMLQFSRKSASTMAPTNLAELIENVLELAGNDFNLKKKFDFRNINVIKEFESGLPSVRCTETEIEQVMLNLLKNATQAMSDSDKPDPRIIIRLSRDGNMARIELEDNGPGMDEETRKRAFEPFYTTKTVGEGTGLGLSVSFMLITSNHDGTIELESELGKGTCFIIKLPLEPDHF